jgi:mutator protein MutT
MAKPHHHIAIALVHRDERWLVTKRQRGAHLGGLWEFPGGHQMPHETACDAALRELREECAVQAVPERVLTVVTHEYEDRTVHITPVICQWQAGEPQPVGSDECRWVPADELEVLDMPPANRVVVRGLLKEA